MAEELKIIASVQGFDKVEKGLNDIATAAKGTDDAIKPLDKDLKAVGSSAAQLPANLNSTSKALANTAVQAQKLDSSLGKNVVKGSNQASLALINVGRVAQDSAFGFVGIANNLNPLLESFQRLRAEAGSNVGALKALVGSLAGGGGVGLALSVVTAALSFASVGLSAWTRGLNNNQKALDDNAKSAKETADALQSIISSVAKEVSQVEVLVASFSKENLSRKEKVGIIKELQQIAPAYFANLDKEKTTVDQLQQAYEAYSNSIVRSIELKVREGQLNKVIEERLALQDKGNKLTNISVDANGKLRKSYNAVYDPTRQNATFKTLVLTSKEQERLNELLATEKQLLDGIVNLKQPQDFIKPESVKKAKESIADVINDLDKKLLSIDLIGSVLGNEKVPQEKIAAIKSTIEKLITDFDVKPGDTIIEQLIGDENKAVFKLSTIFNNLKDLDTQPIANSVQEAITKNGPINITVPANVQLLINNKGTILGPIKDQILIDTNEIEKIVADTFDRIAVAVGVGIGNLITSAGSFGDFFSGIFQEVGAGLKQLGEYFIKAATEILIVKKLAAANPALAIAAGIALVALGTIIQNTTRKGFALGGTFDGSGGTFLAGERGPELITAPAGTRITPASQTNSILGSGQNVRVEVVGKFDGRYITLANRYGEQALRRQN